jgi:hypothetical protein
VLFIAACATRNWTLDEQVTRSQINALWEAIHEIPDLVVRWRDDAEIELLSYLDQYDERFPDLGLCATYKQARDNS